MRVPAQILLQSRFQRFQNVPTSCECTCYLHRGWHVRQRSLLILGTGAEDV